MKTALLALLVALGGLACAGPRGAAVATAPDTGDDARLRDEPGPEDEELEAEAEPEPGLEDGAEGPELLGPLPDDPALSTARERIVAAARAALGKRPRLDCSGYVLSAYRAAGMAVRLGPARSRSEALFHASRPVDVPRPGDLAFFHDTHDRNRDGKQGDRFTHVALVEAVEGETVTLLHRGGRVARIRMDLLAPSDPERNDPVRVRRKRDRRGTRYLTGELFAAFGALLGGDVTQMLQAGRTGETSARHPATR